MHVIENKLVVISVADFLREILPCDAQDHLYYEIIHAARTNKSFIVAIYYGSSKPKDLSQYIKQFIAELNYLQKNGINLFQKIYC